MADIVFHFHCGEILRSNKMQNEHVIAEANSLNVQSVVILNTFHCELH